MDSERGNSSNPLIKEQANLVRSSLSSCVDRTEEVLSNMKSAFTGCSYSTPTGLLDAANQIREIESHLFQVLKSLDKTRAIIHILMGDTNAATSLQQSQVATPLGPGIRPQNQASLPYNRAALPQSNIHQQNQAAHQLNRASVLPQSHNPQQNQALVPYCTRIGSQHEAVPPTIPQASQQPFQKRLKQVLNPETNVAITASGISTRKRDLEALYGGNNEIPETLQHLEVRLIERILAEIIEQDATVKWDDIAGLEHAKNCVHETVLWPVLNPKIFQGVCSIGKGILLFGPPGTGKTMIGKAIAGEMKATFFNISASSLASYLLGEGEKLVRTLFGLARHFQPSVIFFDEIDSILIKRSSNTEHESYRRVKTQLLVEMEGIDSGSEQIVVIGATNRPQDLDEAARRRLSKRLYIPLPCIEARLHIVLHSMDKGGKYALSEQELDRICTETDGYSGSDMKDLIKEAMMGPIRDAIRGVKKKKDIRELEPEDLRPVAFQDFENALKVVRPSVSQQELVGYVEWNAKFGSMEL